MTKFQETIVALTAIRNNLERAILCLYSASGSHLASKPERLKDQNLLFTLNNYLQILLCSFLEEWSKFGGFAKKDESVKETLRIVSPATSRFKQWPGLNKIRSSLLAHSPRDKNGKIVFPWVAFGDEKCPTTYEETLLLTSCVLMAVDNAKARHKSEQEEVEKEILAMNRTIAIRGIPNTSELEKQFADIQKQIEENKKRT